MPSTPRSIISSKNSRTLLASAPSNKVVFVVSAEAALQRFADSLHCLVVGAFAAHRKIVMLAQPVHVHDKRKVLAGLELVDLFLQQQAIGAQVDILLARNQAFHNLGDLWMHQGFATRNADQRRAALIHRLETLFRRQIGLQDVGRILNLPATRTRQVAAE